MTAVLSFIHDVLVDEINYARTKLERSTGLLFLRQHRSNHNSHQSNNSSHNNCYLKTDYPISVALLFDKRKVLNMALFHN